MALREAIQKGFLSYRPKKTLSFSGEKLAPRCSAFASLTRLRGEKCFLPRACRGKKRFNSLLPPAGGKLCEASLFLL